MTPKEQASMRDGLYTACAIDGCDKRVAGRGWCGAHYMRWRRTGDPLGSTRPPKFDRPCSVEGCTKPYDGRGYCSAHLQAVKRADPGTPRCSIEGCEMPVRTRDLCSTHYGRLWRNGDPKKGARPIRGTCSVDGCSRPHYAREFCLVHYARLRRHGTATPGSTYGSGSITGSGYRQLYLPEHPNANKAGYVLEHLVVMSEHLGRPIVKPETVHHRNGQRADNRIENLELWASDHPAGQRVVDLVEWARYILAKYADEVDAGLI